jgi:hypothetical protein
MMQSHGCSIVLQLEHVPETKALIAHEKAIVKILCDK